MSKIVFILGPSGEGKSRSMLNMDPETTIIINSDLDPLPHKQLVANFTEGKNLFSTSRITEIDKKLQEANANPKIKSVVVDTWTRIMTDMRMSPKMRNAMDGRKAWGDFANIVYDVFFVNAKKLRPDLIIYLLGHVEKDASTSDDGFDTGKTQAAVQGQLIKKMFPESFSSIVLYTHVERIIGAKPTFHFTTVPIKDNTCKTPEGMFDTDLIENDLAFVDKKIREYYSI